MKISTKGRYALRMLADLAANRGRGYISLKEIAVRQCISKQYLEQIVTLLHTSDILSANRGKQGGYSLARDPAELTVGYILRVTEGGLAPVVCLDGIKNPCGRAGDCITLPVWKGLEKVITDYLDGITLKDVIEMNGVTDNGNYVI